MGGNHGEEIVISVVGDWGSGSLLADQVAKAMDSFEPAWTAHLGDVYHVGTTREVKQKCIGESEPSGPIWPPRLT